MPTSTRPYRNQQIKNASSQSLSVKPKDMTRHDKIEGERKEHLKLWITFMRRNPVRLIESYFGIHLHPFEILMIWMLQKCNLSYIVASRAASKTWIMAVWALTLCTLYPGIKLVVCGKTLKQGGLVLSEKLTSLRDNYPNVAREIYSITYNANNYQAIFHNGSTIKVVPSSDSSRGNRANFILVEESRLIPKEILDSVIKPFLEIRNPPFKDKLEYRNDPLLKEEGAIAFITSAWFKSEYWYEMAKSCIMRVVNGDENTGFLAFDYLITLHHNIKSELMLKNEMADMDATSVQHEYLNVPSGSSGKSYFKSTLFNRNIKKAFYPQKSDTYTKKNPYEIKKTEGEIRFITCDIATRANKVNDLSINGAVRCVPLLGKGYNRQLLYMESFKGANTLVQAKRIKELFEDFEADYLVLDMMNAGIAIFDALSQVTVCDERGIEFPAFTVVNQQFQFIDEKVRQELQQRTLGLGAKQVIFPISATQSLNNQISVAFRSSLQKKLWNFLINDTEAEEYLLKSNKEMINNPDDSEIFAYFMNPYIQTGLLIGECINLDMTLVNGLIKLVEKSGTYKDRYSAISYANWIISHFDKDLLQDQDDSDDFTELMKMMQVV